MSRKLAVIEERHRQQKAKKSPAVQVTQGELNSYLNLSYAPSCPRGSATSRSASDTGRIEAKGYVDIEQVKGKRARQLDRGARCPS